MATMVGGAGNGRDLAVLSVQIHVLLNRSALNQLLDNLLIHLIVALQTQALDQCRLGVILVVSLGLDR